MPQLTDTIGSNEHQPTQLAHLLGGKGVEEPSNSIKRPFKCGHRFALVCRKKVTVSTSEKPKGGRIGWVLVQTCRYCGCFRSTMISFRGIDGQILQDSQILFMDSGAGLKTLTFEFKDQEA